MLFEYIPDFDNNSNAITAKIDSIVGNQGGWGVFNKTGSLDVNTSTLTLEDISNNSYTFSRSYSYTTSEGQIVWEGNCTSGLYPNGKIFLTIKNGFIEGIIRFNIDYNLGLIHLENNLYIMYLMNGNSDADEYVSLQNSSSNGSSPGGRIGSACSGIYIYRLVIAYTPQFAATFPSGPNKQKAINNYLIDVVNSVNDTYIHSLVNVRARLAFSYQTPDSEIGDKDKDIKALTILAPTGGNLSKFDEIYIHRAAYNADAAVLLTSYNAGGVATPFGSHERNWALYGKNGAGSSNFGVAHEMGHLFGLEHNIEEMSFSHIAVELAYLRKRAFGYRRDSLRCVMSYGESFKRLYFYSDQDDYTFPDGGPAGNIISNGREYMLRHLGNVVRYDDKVNIMLNNRTYTSDQMSNLFAYSTIEASNVIINEHARVNLKAQDQIRLLPGTHIKKEAQLTASLISCGNSSGFRIAQSSNDEANTNFDVVSNSTTASIGIEEFKETNSGSELTIYPNPSKDEINITVNLKSNENATLTIRNLNGECIYYSRVDKNSNGANIISGDIFKNGVYYAELVSESGIRIIRRIIIIK